MFVNVDYKKLKKRIYKGLQKNLIKKFKKIGLLKIEKLLTENNTINLKEKLSK